MFANGPEDQGSIPLSTQDYKVNIKGKVEKSREESSALLHTSV